MLIKEYKCDWCGKTTPDYGMEPGWIHINNHNLKISNSDKYARLTSLIRTNDMITKLDFCSLQCFMLWLYLSQDTSPTNTEHTDEDVQLLKQQIANIQYIDDRIERQS